jgi:hypothetical protein
MANALRTGKVDLTVALSPTAPPRVQALQFDRVTD